MGASLHTWNKKGVYGMEAHILACVQKIQSCAISREGLRLWRNCLHRVYVKGDNYSYWFLLSKSDIAVQHRKEQDAWKVKQRHCSHSRQCNTTHSAHNTCFASTFSMKSMIQSRSCTMRFPSVRQAERTSGWKEICQWWTSSNSGSVIAPWPRSGFLSSRN